MKKLLLSALVSSIASLTLTANAATLTNYGALTVKWTVYQDGATTTNTVTTSSKTATNVDFTEIRTVKTKSFGNADLLALLANSFGTNFAAGDSLAIDNSGSDSGPEFYVVDKTGKNTVLNVSSVLTLSFSNTVKSLAKSITTVTEETGPKTKIVVTNFTSPHSSFSESMTGVAVFSYDDSSRLTNGATTLQIGGFATTSIDENPAKLTSALNFTMPNGAGSGTIKGTNSVVSGSVTGGAKGPISEPIGD